MISIDIETLDPNIKTLGSGAVRNDGAILCIGLYDGRDYVCCEPSDQRLKDWLASDEDKVFHNAVYDMGWLVCGYGFTVNGRIHDTMTRTALVDEYCDMNLDACCKKFLVKGKNAADTIETWYEQYKGLYGMRGGVWQNADIVWMHPAGREAMIKYNKQDCIATYMLFEAQEPFIRQVAQVYDIECRSVPIVMEMKKNGIRIDEVARDRFTAEIKTKYADVEQQLSYKYGITAETIRSPKQMTIAMNQLGIQSPVTTPTGGQSWSADALDLIDHDAVALIQECKNYDALINKYLDSALTKHVVNGRIHCTFSPNKRADGGTITGRYASSDPNLQNIPARDEKHGQKSYGQEMRSLFIPDDGCFIAASDYSQIEYLLLAHYAHGPQAQWFRQQANDGVDFHTVAQGATGIQSRDIVKRLNYGIIYGMGVNKMVSINRKLFKQLATENGESTLQFAHRIFEQYHERLPVIRDTMRWIQNESKRLGYFESIGGRRHHKPKPQFIDGKLNDFIYKMTNYALQGSAAEILKLGMLQAWDAGVFNTLKLHLTIHDENVVSVPYSHAGTDALITMNECMASAYHDRLSVPMKVACEVGPTWGYWKGDIWERMQKGDYSDSDKLRPA